MDSSLINVKPESINPRKSNQKVSFHWAGAHLGVLPHFDAGDSWGHCWFLCPVQIIYVELTLLNQFYIVN